MMKRLTAVLLTAVMLTLLLVSCGEKASDDLHTLYFYSGNETEDNGDVTDEMVDRLKEMGYPEDRFTYHRAEIGGHEPPFWRSIFSEFLNAMNYQGL